jgi:outer membrane protein OmpA-like peptidoglycan-associated protein
VTTDSVAGDLSSRGTGPILPAARIRSLDLPGFVSHLELRTCHLQVTIANEAIGFALDSASVDNAGRSKLVVLARELAGATDTKVVGHTSTEGDGAYNQQLSERRAQAVADVIQSAVPGLHVAVAGDGERNPLVFPDDTEEKRAANRRVNVDANVQRPECG